MGSSGSGKTTLMSCIIGINRLDGGNIEVFGEPSKKVDNTRIGFMPQECALTLGFSVRENFTFFGTIYGMKPEKIEERFQFLSKLLELPDEDRLVRDCSGGQQRRLSFAVTLVHEPELLILDEPTVGVDPLLRTRIWDYLVGLAAKNVTILLSTHYIEEARQSDVIGIMRNGVQMVEDSAENILKMCETTDLEDAFLRLSQRQEAGLAPSTSNEPKYLEYKSEESLQEVSSKNGNFNSTALMISDDFVKKRKGKFLKALLWKHLIERSRDYE